MKKNANSETGNQGNSPKGMPLAEIRKSGKQEIRKSGKQEIRKSGKQPQRSERTPLEDALPKESFGLAEIRKSGLCRLGGRNRKLGNQSTQNSKLNTPPKVHETPLEDPFGKNFLLTLVLALAFSFVLPWWSVMLAAFLAGAIVRLKNVAAFFAPFLATSLFWIAYAWVLSSSNDFILAKKISVLFYLKGNAWLLLLLTGVIGGLSAGVAGVFGSQFRAVFSKQNS